MFLIVNKTYLREKSAQLPHHLVVYEDISLTQQKPSAGSSIKQKQSKKKQIKKPKPFQ